MEAEVEGDGGGGGGLSDQQKLQVLRREFLKLREEHAQLQAQLAEFPKLKAKVKRIPPHFNVILSSSSLFVFVFSF
jgi:hypothetical protein